MRADVGVALMAQRRFAPRLDLSAGLEARNASKRALGMAALSVSEVVAWH
jgi:hypothetical protein